MHLFLIVMLPLLLVAKPFKVATYNVQNLFDASYQGSEYKEYVPGTHNWNKRTVEVKLNHIAEVICDLNADILGLQEIENALIFKQLREKLEDVGCGYKYGAITSKRGAPIQVALLSRYPITKERQIQVSYAPRVRNILEVEVNIQGVGLSVFVNHWKSKAYKGFESKRIKYAKALQSRLSKLPKTKEYILIGDFNSDYNAYLSLEQKLNDTDGKTGFSDILQTKIDEYEISSAPQGSHYTLWKELDVEHRWSHKFYGKRSSLDHIVLPREMFDAKGIDYVDNSFGVFKPRYLFTKRGYINAWRYKNGKHRVKGYSDHLPIYALFDIKPYVSESRKKQRKGIEENTIEDLYKLERLQEEVKLNDVVVIFKRGHHAIVKQHPNSRGIFLYGCAGELKEGYKYDLLVDGIKTYKGLKEIISAYTLKEKGRVNTKVFMKHVEGLERLEQNEVITGIKGLYNNRHLYVDGKQISIYFKKKKSWPKNGTQVMIDYAHLGYYKKKQLVVYNAKDFRVLE
jgi:exonuclease III